MWYCFDSKLVRLKVEYKICCAYVSLVEFRFQTGSIKSSQFTALYPDAYQGFRFQTGSIKSKTVNPLRITFNGFDSKLVRLKVRLWKCFRLWLARFDSKLVRLKGGSAYITLYFLSFRFQTGSIKSDNPRASNRFDVRVSIPNWFD